MRSMWHYRDIPVICREYETREFVNLQDVSYHFYDHFNVSISTHRLHKFIVSGDLVLGRFSLLYNLPGADKVSNDEENGLFKDPIGNKRRRETDGSSLRETRVRLC